MTIYDALKNDHRKVEKLLDRLVEASKNDQEKWKDIVAQIAEELIPHARAEEALFYNPIRENQLGVAMHGYAEHAMAETELRALQAMTVIDANWTALVEKLCTDLKHHVEEEETKIFDAAKKVFTDEEAVQISQAFHKLKPYVKEQGLMGQSFDLIVNMLPKRWSDTIRKQFTSKDIGSEGMRKTA